MNREIKSMPNIVVDDNYRMLVNRLTRRYAERGASIYTDADAIEQERSDARARAIAPDAYRISKTLGDNAEMYKSEQGKGVRYMTTDDYLVYFSKCHDTFDAVNYYNLHSDTPEEEGTDAEIKPRVLVSRKRLEAIKKTAEATPARPRRQRSAQVLEFSEKSESMASRMRTLRRKATGVLAAMSACLAILIGGVAAFSPETPEVNSREIPEHSVMSVADYEGDRSVNQE